MKCILSRIRAVEQRLFVSTRIETITTPATERYYLEAHSLVMAITGSE